MYRFGSLFSLARERKRGREEEEEVPMSMIVFIVLRSTRTVLC